jgi:Tol biopolymer transport system component
LADGKFEYDAAFSSDGQWIAFTSERSGSSDIYRARSDGSGLERLTDDPGFDDQAAFSPDGKQVAFVSARGAGNTNIWNRFKTTTRA